MRAAKDHMSLHISVVSPEPTPLGNLKNNIYDGSCQNLGLKPHQIAVCACVKTRGDYSDQI